MTATAVRPSKLKARKIQPTTGWQNRSWAVVWETPELPFTSPSAINPKRQYTRTEVAYIHWLRRKGCGMGDIMKLTGLDREAVKNQLGKPCPLPPGVEFDS